MTLGDISRFLFSQFARLFGALVQCSGQDRNHKRSSFSAVAGLAAPKAGLGSKLAKTVIAKSSQLTVVYPFSRCQIELSETVHIT